VAQADFRFGAKSRPFSSSTKVQRWADIVAKVFLHDQSRNLLAVGATFE
jgi:hypothetical protein